MGKRDDRNDAELQEGDGLVRTTIVGGQPRKRPTIRMSIRVGLERVLYLASRDRGFRNALLDDREKALETAGLELSAGESAVLASVDGKALETMVNNVRPESRKDHRFVKAVAATFVTLATGTTACGQDSGSTDLNSYMPGDVGTSAEIVDLDATSEFSAGVDPGVLTDVSHDMPAVGGTFPDDIPSMELDVSEPGGDHGVLPDVVETDVGQPMEGGSSADVIEESKPRKR